MKKKHLIFILLISCWSCSAQQKKVAIKLDTIPFDLSKIEIYSDTLFFDLNNDNKDDILLKLSYRYKMPIPEGESGQILTIYVNNGDGLYKFKASNKKILWLIHSSITQIDKKSFTIINEGSGQDWNRYYCYFEYDETKENWFLIKQEIYKFDDENRILVNKYLYNKSTKIPFENVSFDILFKKYEEEVPEPSFYKKIFVEKAFIFNSTFEKTKTYLVKGDEIKIVNKNNIFYKIYYYGNKNKTIKGWIKKSDITNNNNQILNKK